MQQIKRRTRDSGNKRIQRPKNYFGKIPLFFIYLILGFYAFTLIYPMLWVLMNSFKSLREFYVNPFNLPINPTLQNYINAFAEVNIGRYLFNSVWYTVAQVALSQFLTCYLAYVMAKYRFKFKNFLTGICIAGFLIPSLNTFPTWYRFMTDMHFTGYLGLFINNSGVLGGGLLIYISFFKSIEWSYAEAAFVEGAGHFRVFTKIMLPLAAPGIAVMSMFSLIGTWNDYLIPQLLLRKEKFYTIGVGLQALFMKQQYQADWTVLFAGVILAALPIFIVFLFLKDYILEGYSMSLK